MNQVRIRKFTVLISHTFVRNVKTRAACGPGFAGGYPTRQDRIMIAVLESERAKRCQPSDDPNIVIDAETVTVASHRSTSETTLLEEPVDGFYPSSKPPMQFRLLRQGDNQAERMINVRSCSNIV